jgi:hypothetical protein
MWDKARGNKKLLLPPDELPVRSAPSLRSLRLPMCDGPLAVRARSALAESPRLVPGVGAGQVSAPHRTGARVLRSQVRARPASQPSTALSLADALALLACSANAPTNAFYCEISFGISLHHSRVCCCAREICADMTQPCERQAKGGRRRRGDARRLAGLTHRSASRSARCSRRTRALGGRPKSRTCCTQEPARAVGSMASSPSLRARVRAGRRCQA